MKDAGLVRTCRVMGGCMTVERGVVVEGRIGVR